MTFNSFIQQANLFGEKQQPFFFLIDFEQKMPVICPLQQAGEQGFYFDIAGIANIEKVRSNLALNLQIFPMSLQDYQKGFSLVQQELQKGNSYLLNLTYPTEIKMNFSLLDCFYQAKAKYKLYYQDQFVCFSPEPFVNIHHNQIYTYPMKGTIDATLPDAENCLLDSDKERQEHYTIVDLMRNDLAIVAKNIEVKSFRYVEKIETERGAILQTSSEIIGQLESDWQQNIGNILANLLPAGSISGAPKQKTVEIIQQAEKIERGYYTGIFGIFDGNSLESAVAIRFIEQVDGKMYFRSGGGITKQSELADEYAELCQKVYIPLNRMVD